MYMPFVFYGIITFYFGLILLMISYAIKFIIPVIIIVYIYNKINNK